MDTLESLGYEVSRTGDLVVATHVQEVVAEVPLLKEGDRITINRSTGMFTTTRQDIPLKLILSIYLEANQDFVEAMERQYRYLHSREKSASEAIKKIKQNSGVPTHHAGFERGYPVGAIEGIDRVLSRLGLDPNTFDKSVDK